MGNRCNFHTVRGMRDYFPWQICRMEKVIDTCKDVFHTYHYQPIKTPIIEQIGLFNRSLGSTSDILEKEIFMLSGKDNLCLKPEGTSSVIRAWLENNLQSLGINKVYYIDSMFRAERPQAGRYRQFIQIGVESFDNSSFFTDVEVISLLYDIFSRIGLSDCVIDLNYLGCVVCCEKYKKILFNHLIKIQDQLCNHCQTRLHKNALRVLDCKIDTQYFEDLPTSQSQLCEPCLVNYQKIKSLLSSSNIPFQQNDLLVRGLDYYSGAIFELHLNGMCGSQDTLAAGGRFDTLVEYLGGNPSPSVGFAMGLDRVLLALEQVLPVKNFNTVDVFVIVLDEKNITQGFQLLQSLRRYKISAEALFNKRSLRSQMRYANQIKSRFCIIIGEDEIQNGLLSVKNMKDNTQMRISEKDLLIHLFYDLPR